MHRLIRVMAVAAIGALTTACGEDGGGDGMGGTGGIGVDLPTAESYYPQKVGNSWTYLVTPIADLPSYKVVTIDSAELVGGTGASAGRPAYRHTTCKSSPSVEACAMPPSATNKVDRTIGWLGMVGKVLGNYREQSFKKATETLTEEDWWEPFRTKVDNDPAHTVLGAKWTDVYKEYKQPSLGIRTVTMQMEQWEVLAVNETVTVTPPNGPAKTYPNCIKVTHTTGGGTSNKIFWYARGIGKVKETGAQTEELIDYEVAP